MAQVLIVGATSAIASAVARACAERGDRLFLIARDAKALSDLAGELREISGLDDCVMGVASGDFNECESNSARVAQGLAALGSVDLALIAHGLLGDQLKSERDYSEARRITATNLDSVISFLIPIANALEAQGRGSVAVMSSVAAERGRPRNYTYAAAKAGVNTYLEGMRTRLWKAGVRVHILKLGPVDSPMTVDHPKNPLFATPDRVAGGILRAIERGRFAPYLPWYWWPIMLVVRNLPEVIVQRIPFLSGR
jgi:short-subunit dehydrogenase